jgi:hypothetical protein
LREVKVIFGMELLFVLMFTYILTSIGLGVWLLLGGEWFRAWLRGSFAIFFLLTAFFSTLFAYELLRLDAIKMDSPMGSIHLKQKGEKGEILFTNLKQQQEAVSVTSLQSSWSVVIDSFSLVHGGKGGQAPVFYKLHSVKVGDTETPVGAPPLFFNIFKVLSLIQNSLPIFSVHQYTSEPVSFVDQAEFTLIKRGDRLIAWPGNHHAQKAVPVIQNTQK